MQTFTQMAKACSLTDWISALGTVLGVPVAVWAIIKLFRKDLDKERQLSALDGIVTAQMQLNQKMQLEIDQLITQTGIFQHQANLMADQNHILREQLQLQNLATINAERFGKESQALKEKERRNSIKPDFVVRHSNYSQGHYSIQLANLGLIATNIKADSLIPVNVPINVERDEVRTNSTITLTFYLGQQVPYIQVSFKIRLAFDDADQNRYYQDIEAASGAPFIARAELHNNDPV